MTSANAGDAAGRGAGGDAERPDGAPGTGEGAPEGAQREETPPDADDDLGDVVVPDDLSGLLDESAGPPSVALVVTQVAAPGPLAAACALASVGVDAVPSPVGAIAVLRDPAAAGAGAAAISQLLRQLPVVLLERHEGQITATRWTNGERGDELPPGLVLSDAPAVLEDLLLGSVAVADLDGVVTSVGLSRWKAMRLLASSARRQR